MILMAMSTLMSYYTFLEEYYIGKLILGKVGGPDDVSLGLSAICFYTAWGGSVALWGQPMTIFGERLTIFGIEDICCGPFLISCVMAFNMINVGQSLFFALKANQDEETFNRRYTPLTFNANMSFMFVLLGVYLWYTQCTGSTILYTHPKLTTLAYGGQFLNAVHRV